MDGNTVLDWWLWKGGVCCRVFERMNIDCYRLVTVVDGVRSCGCVSGGG